MFISNDIGKKYVVSGADWLWRFNLIFQAAKSILYNILTLKDIVVKKLALWEALGTIFLQFFPRKSLFISTRELEISIVINEEIPRKIVNELINN